MTQTAGFNTVCAIQSGALFCWGSSEFGLLGNGSMVDSGVPAPVTGMDSLVTDISVGEHHACAIQAGTVHCWGEAEGGKLGNAMAGDSATPVPVNVLGSNAVTVSASHAGSCAIMQDETLWCWGENPGDGSSQQDSPVRVPGIAAASMVAVGHGTACVVDGNAVKCWGQNNRGQLGDGTLTDRLTPAPVAGISGAITSLAIAGLQYAAFVCVAVDGQDRCWGDYRSRQIPTGLEHHRLTPEPTPAWPNPPL